MNRLQKLVKRKSQFLLIIGLLGFVSVLLAAQKITLNTTGRSPLNEENGSGFMDRIARLAFHGIGYDLQTVKLPAERGLKNANAGIEDGEMSRVAGITILYGNLRFVPEAIMDWEFMLFTRQGVDSVKGWAGLANKTVAYINGWKILEKHVPASAEVTTVKNVTQLFFLLFKRRVDYIIYERWGGLKYLQDAKMTGYKLIEPPLAIKPMYIYLHKKHQLLIPKLTQALRNLKKEGSYQKIYNDMRNRLIPTVQ